MSKRLVPLLLIALLLIVQGQLWFGRGSVRVLLFLDRLRFDRNIGRRRRGYLAHQRGEFALQK